MHAELFWLDDQQWKAISGHLPVKQRGPKRVDDRTVISGIIHVLQSGSPWRACPPQYGPYMTVFNRFNRWKRRGIWQRIVLELAANDELSHPQTGDESPSVFHRLLRELDRDEYYRRDNPRAYVGTGPLPAEQASRAGSRVISIERRASELEARADAHGQEPGAEWIYSVLKRHIQSLERQVHSLTAEAGPGEAGKLDPLVEQALSRFYSHQVKAAIGRLTVENVDLTTKLVSALKCIEFYAGGAMDAGAHAKATIKVLLAQDGRVEPTQTPIEAMADAGQARKCEDEFSTRASSPFPGSPPHVPPSRRSATRGRAK
ncbi:MAG: transposase [Xanthobacteraceae bacterium]